MAMKNEDGDRYHVWLLKESGNAFIRVDRTFTSRSAANTWKGRCGDRLRDVPNSALVLRCHGAKCPCRKHQ